MSAGWRKGCRMSDLHFGTGILLLNTNKRKAVVIVSVKVENFVIKW
jgi:hypothetical protein